MKTTANPFTTERHLSTVHSFHPGQKRPESPTGKYTAFCGPNSPRDHFAGYWVAAWQTCWENSRAHRHRTSETRQNWRSFPTALPSTSRNRWKCPSICTGLRQRSYFNANLVHLCTMNGIDLVELLTWAQGPCESDPCSPWFSTFRSKVKMPDNKGYFSG